MLENVSSIQRKTENYTDENSERIVTFYSPRRSHTIAVFFFKKKQAFCFSGWFIRIIQHYHHQILTQIPGSYRQLWHPIEHKHGVTRRH